MLSRLILLFILVPLADLILLMILIRIHWMGTLGLIIVSGIVGAFLARRQGLAVTAQIREQLSNNEMPTDALINGAMILLAAGLLLTPGLLTDIVGFSIMIPSCRRWYRNRFTSALKRRFQVSTFGNAFTKATDQWKDDENVIDSYVVSSSEEKESNA